MPDREDDMDEAQPKTPFRWLFEDRDTGRIVIGQMPNALMWLFFVALAATYIPMKNWPKATARIVASVSLALWALDEIVRGVNPWRRILGGATLVGIAIYWLWRQGAVS